MKSNKSLLYGFGLFTLMLLLACKANPKKEDKQSESTQIQATDSRGKTVKLSKIATRVVVLFEPMVDEIYMLGAEQTLVGIPNQVYLNQSSYHFLSKLDQRIKSKQIPTPTFGGNSSNLESIIASQPDLVIVYQQDRETITQLEELGIPAFTVSSLNKEAILAELLGVGKLLGKEGRAQEIIVYIEDKIKAHDKASFVDIPKKVYYAWSKGRILSTSGKGTLTEMAIELAGAQNACQLQMEAPNIGVETLYQWNPDMIILWNSKAEDIYQLSELSNLRAVKEKQVFVMNPSFLYDPHTVKFMLFANQLRHWCYPNNYTEKQLAADSHEFMRVIYGDNAKNLYDL